MGPAILSTVGVMQFPGHVYPWFVSVVSMLVKWFRVCFLFFVFLLDLNTKGKVTCVSSEKMVVFS